MACFGVSVLHVNVVYWAGGPSPVELKRIRTVACGANPYCHYCLGRCDSAAPAAAQQKVPLTIYRDDFGVPTPTPTSWDSTGYGG